MRRKRTNRIVVMGLVAALLPAAMAAAYVPDPLGLTYEVGIGGRPYLRVGAVPVMLALRGPGTFYGYARTTFLPGEAGKKQGRLQVSGLPGDPITLPLTFEPSTESDFDDGRPGQASAGARFEVKVPDGAWTLVLRGDVDAPTDGADEIFVTLYYDGPRQTSRKGTASAKSSPWSWHNRAGLELIYDDNILTQSPDAFIIFENNSDPAAFRIHSTDDLLVVPSVDLEVRRNLFDFGQTRVRFRVKYWHYTYNPIKTNTDFDFYLRQYWGRKTSFELYVNHAPEQYIRQLNDFAPFQDPETPTESKEFRFTRNVVNLTWRQSVSRRVATKLSLETNRRYYNKPFIENDIEAWELRGNVRFRATRWLDIDVDYGWEDAAGRGYDTVGETPETSDDGDPSYERDLYRLGFGIDTPFLDPVVDGLDVAGLFMDYYYTTKKPIFDAPFQRGRRDKWGKVFVTLHKRLNRRISLDVGFTYSERAVESPWYGDITLDKNYIQHRYSVGADYRF